MNNGSDHEKNQTEPSEEDLLDLNEIMQAFGVTAWKNLGPTDLSHDTGLSLLVEIQEQRYVLRERPEGWLGEDISHRYAFQQYLQQAAIPIPSFWLSTRGEPYVAVGEDAFELQRLPAGEQFASADPRSLDRIAFAGSMLAHIHQASQHYTGPQHRWPTEAHPGGIVQGYLNLARSRAEEHSVQAIAAALNNWAEEWEAVLPSAMMSIGAGNHSLPELHIHGDYHALNVRFGSAGVSAVTGLEASRWEKRIFEVANGLFNFSALSWLPGSETPSQLVKRGFDPERAQRFLHAYAEVYVPGRGEAALLADACMLVTPIASANGPLEDLFYTQGELSIEVIDEVLERLNWATALPAWLKRVRHALTEMWI
jgi:Ser/Thr protein kinase RdoA (MazF antagonist)